nr:hypothetical protein [Chromobacterium sp. ASV5]
MGRLDAADIKRDSVDILRVRYWYSGVMKALGCSRPYQIERRLEPGRFRLKDGHTSYPNKWGGYAKGVHKPRVAQVRMVESHVPGSARELNHPLWAILLRMGKKPIIIADWIARLDPSVQACVLVPQHDRFGAPRILATFNRRNGQKLLRRGDLDALAALLLYWIDAGHRKALDEQEELGGVIYQLLLIVGLDFFKRKLCAEFFTTFRSKVLDITPWTNGYFAVDASTFETSLLILHRLAHPEDDPSQTPQWRKRVRKMLDLLSGKMGYDLFYSMQPFFIPKWEAGPPTRSDWAFWEDRRRHWAWGWDCVLQGKIGKFPPDDARVPGWNYPRHRTDSVSLTTPSDHGVSKEGVIFQYGEWPPLNVEEPCYKE